MQPSFKHTVENVCLDNNKYDCRVTISFRPDNKMGLKILSVYKNNQMELLNDDDLTYLAEQCCLELKKDMPQRTWINEQEE